MNRITRLCAITLCAWLVSVPLMAQSVLSSTTLSAAMSDTSSRLMTVASATGFAAPSTGAALVYAIIDREVVSVRTVNGTIIGISRGQLSTRAATHISGAIVWVGPPNAFYSNIPSGQCTRTALTYVPYIVAGGPGNGSEVGSLWDCLGVTTGGQWVQTNGNNTNVLGSTVASPAGVLTPTGTIFIVSGTNAITGITLPAGASPGFTLTLVSSGIWTWTAAGNILTAGTTTAAGRAMQFIWHGSKWVPVAVA